MKITKKIYFIATISKPIRLINERSEKVDTLDNAYIFFNKDEAEGELADFDEPEKFEIVEGEIVVDL